MALCEELNLSHNFVPDSSVDVIFTSWISEVDQVFAGIDLVCLTSKNEGTPVSLIEAGCAGKPFISTDVGGIRDILIDPEQGIVTPQNNIEAFRRALLNWVITANPGQGLDLDVRKNLSKRYSYKQLCYEMSKVYEELLPS